jgi:hypothetical protein
MSAACTRSYRVGQPSLAAPCDRDVDEALGMRELGRRLERAVDEERAQGAEVERARLAELALEVAERHVCSFGWIRRRYRAATAATARTRTTELDPVATSCSRPAIGQRPRSRARDAGLADGVAERPTPVAAKGSEFVKATADGSCPVV